MIRSKSQSPPSSSLAPCSLEDALEFDSCENVETAYEKMQRTNQQPTMDTIHSGKNAKIGRRHQYGRACSMTFGNRTSKYDNLNNYSSVAKLNNPILAEEGNETNPATAAYLLAHGPMSPDQTFFSEAAGSMYALDSQSFNRSSRRSSIDVSDRLGNIETWGSMSDISATSRKLVYSRRHSSIALDERSVTEKNQANTSNSYGDTSLDNIGSENSFLTRYRGTRRNAFKRAETLPITGTTFFGQRDDLLSSTSSRRLQRGTSTLETIPQRSYSLSAWPTEPDSEPFREFSLDSTDRSSRRLQRGTSTLETIPQRSYSLSAWSTEAESESFGEFSMDSTDRWLIENTDPNQFNILNNHKITTALDMIETDHLDERARGRKKRSDRRHSIQGNLFVDPRPETKPTPVNQISRDPALSWLLSNTQSSPPEEMAFRELSEAGETLDTANSSSHNSCLNMNSSPSTRSVASSRKRGVCDETPPSDIEDWSMSGLPTSLQSNGSMSSRRTRSRSRIFSSMPGAQFPVPPPLISAVSASNLILVGNIETSEPEIEHCRHRKVHRIENIEDTDDEDESNRNSSPDVSMDSGHDSFLMVLGKQMDDHDALNKENVFQNFSSYDDLKFMIKTLRTERCRVEKNIGFGNRSTFDVVPPNAWTSQRRITFFQWARSHLGFTLRSAGIGLNYLQISKAKGVDILTILESALSEYKQIEHNKEKVDDNILVLVQSEFPVTNQVNSNCYKLEGQRTCASPMPLMTMFPVAEDDFTFSLTSKMESMTMQEPRVLKTNRTNSSLSRTVTLHPNDVDERKQGNAPRQSIENGLENNYNFMQHLHGENSPRNGSRKFLRPPRLSVDSTHTMTSASAGCVTTPFGLPSLSTFHSIEIVATPLNDARGWGSRPVSGKDWGNSLQCDEIITKELIGRLEDSCIAEMRRESMESICSLPACAKTWNNLEFDIEADDCLEEDVSDSLNEDDVNDQKSAFEEKKFHQKRMSAFNKRRRMSLWATASSSGNAIIPIHRTKPSSRSTSLCPLAEAYVFGNQPDCLEDVDATKESKPVAEATANAKIVSNVFSFLNENELLRVASPVCVSWADLATLSIANLMFASVGADLDDDENNCDSQKFSQSVSQSMERSWTSLHNQYPWACFLAEGGAKKVFKVYNKSVGEDEALSVMDTFEIQSKQIVANELAISSLLSSLSRRGICPNFVVTRGVFTCSHMPPASHWGTAERKKPKGSRFYGNKNARQPKEPIDPHPGRFQYVRMELINEGDAEELIKRQPESVLTQEVAQAVLFQIAFALHAAADKFSMKHYDIKLLNVFLQKVEAVATGDVVMRYGLGSHTFALRMPNSNAYIAKLADFGTANINVESNGQPVTIAQFTTLENTPPDFMILGDDARQGHGHDNFGLGLCMLHLFTGSAPYEEILEEVKCPSNFKKRLRAIWENEKVDGYSIIYSLINDGVVKDEAGHIVEGEPDETLYDTLYRYLVLFGVPVNEFEQKRCPKVWKAISDSFMITSNPNKQKGYRNLKRPGSDRTQYNRDCKKYSLQTGNDKRISRARLALQSIAGGMELLFQLCSFDPLSRGSAMEVLNSTFMEKLRESPDTCPQTCYSPETTLFEYTAFSTHQNRV